MTEVGKGGVFSDLDPTVQARILEQRSIIFQGNEVSLKELLPPLEKVDLDEVIDSDVLIKFLKNEKITVGKKLTALDETVEYCYIPRILNDFPEDQILQGGSYKGLTCLVGATGSGKSTTLKNIAVLIKRIRPYLWVLQIDLKDYSNTMRAFKENNLRPVTLLSLLNSKPESKLSRFEEKIFSLPEKLVILLDGIEEVGPDLEGVVFRLTEECGYRRTNVCHAEGFFLTRLPRMAQFNEWSCSLKAFSRENQLEFLHKYWRKKFWDKDKCKTFAETVINEKWFEGNDEVIGIPLQIRMVAEILEKRNNLDDGSTWEGCYDFLRSRNPKPVLPKKITLTELYRLYIHKNCSNGAKSRLDSVKSDIAKINVESDGYLYVLALESVLNKERCHYFTCYKNKVDNIPEKKLLTFGIIKKVDTELQFTHRSFAEYFVAECIFNELSDPKNELILTPFINEVLVEEKFNVVRVFLNTFIEEDLNALTNEACKSLGHVLKNTRKFSGLYVSAKEGLLGITKLLFNCFDAAGSPINVNSVAVNSETPLHAAIKGAHEKIIKFLVEKGADIEARNDKGDTPLHLAVGAGDFGLVIFLVESGASVTCKNGDGCSVLRQAAEGGHLEMVKYLVEHGADINSRCQYGSTALHAAAKKGQLNIVRYLVENGADVNSRSRYNSWVLSNAIQSGNPDVIKYLVENGADITVRDNRWAGTMLHVELTKSDKAIDIFKFLMEKGVDINDVDTDGRTVLQKAIAWNCPLGLVKFLVESGADVNRRTHVDYLFPNSKTPLSIALSGKRFDIVKYLIEKGARLDDCPQLNFFVYEIVKEKRLDMVRYLSEKGISMNLKNDEGYSLIEKAVVNNDVDMIKFLVEKGAHISDRALRWAVTICDLDVVKMLVESGKQANMHFSEVSLSGKLDVVKFLMGSGHTFDQVEDVGDNVELLRYLLDNNVKVDEALVFHKAAETGNLSIIKFLMERGFDVNHTGPTALLKAIEFSNLHVLNYLLEHGAHANLRCKDSDETPLAKAFSCGDLDAVKLLVSKGVNPETGLEGFLEEQDALAEAFKWASLDIIEFLIDKAFNCKLDEFVKRLLESDENQLLNAVFFRLPTVKYLIERGLEIPSEIINRHGLLFAAACARDVELVKHLIEKGGDINDLRPQEVKFIADSGGDTSSYNPPEGYNSYMNYDDYHGKTQLHKAVQSSFTETKTLFETGAEVKLTNDGRSVLHEAIACSSSDLDTVRYIINKGFDVNCKDDNGRTPLLEAVANRYLDTVKLLIEKGATLDGGDISKLKLVHKDVIKIDLDLLRYLVKMGLDVNVRTEAGETFLHHAALNKNVAAVKFLIGKGASVNVLDKEDRSPLYNAVSRNGCLDIVKILIENGADVKGKDKEGHSVPYKAASSKDFTLINYLLEKGALPVSKPGRTVLHESVASGAIDIVKLLVDNGEDVNTSDEDGRTPLHEAAVYSDIYGNGSIDTVRFLLEKGAKVNVRARNGRTPLHEAASRCYLNIVKLLVEHGADPNAKDERGRNPLYDVLTSSRAHNDVSTLDFLIKSGADFTSRDNKSRTMLHVASAEGQGKAVEFLLELGIDVNVKTNDNRTALHESAKNLEADVVKLLVRKGVDVDTKTADGRTALDEASEIPEDEEYYDERRDDVLEALQTFKKNERS